MDMADLALGIDVGGTKVAAVLLDAQGAVLARERGPVAPESNQAGLESIFRVVDRLLDAHPEARGRLLGIGVGAPGAIDWRAGVLRGATNLGWRDLPLAQALRDRYGVPAVADNDVNVAAWGERCFGATAHDQGQPPDGGGAMPPSSGTPRPADHLVFITVGTGIGSGIVESGRIVRGQRSAGELGHIPLVENGPACKCGMIGCLEAVAAGPAFTAAARRLAREGHAPLLLAMAHGNAEAIEAPQVVEAARRGDPGARQLLDREGYYLALAVLIASRMLDPERVVIGGGLAEAGQPLFEAIWSNLARLRPRGPDPRRYAVPSRLGADAGAIGAGSLVLIPEPGFVQAGLLPAGRSLGAGLP
jgi:glucokinase